VNKYIIETIQEERLTEYAQVPISFHGRSILEIQPSGEGFGGFILKEKTVEPFSRDFDLLDSPLLWPQCFDVSKWKLYMASSEGKPVGGAALVMNSAEIRMLEGKKDLACLWDIRVNPDWRGKGLGSALFRTVAREAKESGCLWLKIETQNNNVVANKFYRSQGCHLAQVHLHAYYDVPECKDEVMLFWYLDLSGVEL
jgi:ribosomal protein S18 acetylase RimI-like enzyme